MVRQHNPASAWTRRLVMAFPPLATIVLVFALAASAQAATLVNTDIPLAGQIVNPCNGEVVTYSGTDHFTARETFDNAGGVMLGSHDNIHVTGSGDQGNSYVGNQTDQFVLNLHVGAEETEPLTFSEISQGSAPNFDVHAIYHITVNADGTVTAFVDNFSATCHG